MSDLEFGCDDAREIIIVGGGFGGLYCALELERKLRREMEKGLVRVTLIARDNFFLFTPMLHEVAAGDLDSAHIVNPFHKLLKQVNFFCGEVESVDLRGKTLNVRHGDVLGVRAHEHVLSFDDLVLAPGSVASFHDIAGVAENALTMRTLGDAVLLRARLIETLEFADADCFAQMREPLLTVVVAGGGFSGTETAGAVNDFLRDAVKHYAHLGPDTVRVVLVHSGARLLPELSDKLGDYATKKLMKNGIEVKLIARVESYQENCVVLRGGERIASHTLIWTVGNAPHPMLKNLPCATEKGRVRVDEFLEVSEWPGVWAVGDASCALDENGEPYPPTAQHALRQGKVVAQNIVASLRGESKQPFRFKTLGQMATIGKRAGVANILGVRLSGFPAWFVWRTIYLFKLPRFEKKVRVALDWTLDLFFSKELVQISSPVNSALNRIAHPEAKVEHGANESEK